MTVNMGIGEEYVLWLLPPAQNPHPACLVTQELQGTISLTVRMAPKLQDVSKLWSIIQNRLS
jgi:hypothetical protein